MLQILVDAEAHVLAQRPVGVDQRDLTRRRRTERAQPAQHGVAGPRAIHAGDHAQRPVRWQ
jgi:hypothetical protein